jgi:hypothetical protein
MGMMLVGHLASTCVQPIFWMPPGQSSYYSCGDHLLPHLAEIVDMTTYLAESVPRSMVQV